MKMGFSTAAAVLNELIERKPSVGYIGAAVPTATGFWAFVEGATKIGAFVSVVVGLVVGITTWQVQRLNKRKALAEIAALESSKKPGSVA
jgi:uncharacterized membrane protein